MFDNKHWCINIDLLQKNIMYMEYYRGRGREGREREREPDALRYDNYGISYRVSETCLRPYRIYWIFPFALCVAEHLFSFLLFLFTKHTSRIFMMRSLFISRRIKFINSFKMDLSFSIKQLALCREWRLNKRLFSIYQR